MHRFFLPILFLLAAVPAAAAEPVILPFDQVQAGMKGTGRTVFSGTRVVPFDVEILGKLPNVGPGQNLILGRCSGGPLAKTGILAGMSGSPVYVDGKLVGAVAYSWGFATDAIAGITPADEMLAVSRLESNEPRRPAAAGLAGFDQIYRPEKLDRFLTVSLPSLLPRSAGPVPAALPLTISGLGPEGFSHAATLLSGAGFLPVQGGGSGSAAERPPAVEPGSAVGLKLVRGDVDMTATGTVTWVDGNRVLAFGHRLFGLGTVDLPMTGARVEALLPSLQQSSRLAVPLAEIGAVKEDRSAAVLGRLEARAAMIPVRVRLASSGGEDHLYSFDVVRDPLLAPILLYTSLNGILATAERVQGSVTLRVEEGSVIKMKGVEDVEVDNLFAGATATYFATGTPAFILYLLMNNEWRTPQVEGVNLLLTYDPEPRVARVQWVGLDRYHVPAGETVEATVVLNPYRGAESVYRRKITIPPETPPGTLELRVGDAMAVSRAEAPDEPLHIRNLDHLIRLINHLRRNDRIYLVATMEDTGVMLGGARMPNLPPSVAEVMARPKSRGNFTTMGRRGILEETIPAGVAVEGMARVRLKVEAP